MIIPLLIVFLALGFILPLFGSGSSSTSNSPVVKLPSDSVEMPTDLPGVEVGSFLSGNKTISFLGDSITTYEGWSNNGNTCYETSANPSYYDESKLHVAQTWWHQLARQLNMMLCVNNSYDGGRVTGDLGTYSGVDRAYYLHRDSYLMEPNVIVVYMGTNDVANGVALDAFESAYSEMLRVIRAEYKGVPVYCCTILPESRTVGRETEVANYNEAIRRITESFGYKVIDFAAELTDWDYTKLTFVDGTLRVHPTAEGMDKLTECAYEVMKK